MTETYIEGKTFEKYDFTADKINGEEFENCTFINCNFADADLSNIIFADCIFLGCNLSLAKLSRTAFRNVNLKDCKLLGLRFDLCNEFLFEITADNCNLNMSSFFKLKIKKTNFKNSTLHEADFTETDLTEAVFDNCDLKRATFERTILEKTDFRTAYNYSFDPDLNRIKKAKFSASGIVGLLDKYDIEIV
jgi:fluoroquinolone resistance protein